MSEAGPRRSRANERETCIFDDRQPPRVGYPACKSIDGHHSVIEMAGPLRLARHKGFPKEKTGLGISELLPLEVDANAMGQTLSDPP